MKLRCLKARNVLSFGDEEIIIDFGPFNIIAGPNNSGKTNLFRAFNLIEKAFEQGKPPLMETIYNGDSDRTLYLEVGVELDEIERELIATVAICAEIKNAQGRNTKDLKENTQWKNILINYGIPILSKSFKNISFVLHKDELRISEPKMEIQLFENDETLFFNTSSQISKINQEIRGAYRNLSLTTIILEDFRSKFGNLIESDITNLLTDHEKLLKESPLLPTLLRGKLDGTPKGVVQLEGAAFWDLTNSLREESILNRLYVLCERNRIDYERLYLWQIFKQLYSESFVNLKELRLFTSTPMSSSASKDGKTAAIEGTSLAIRLFQLMTSGKRKDRERFSRIKKAFKDLIGSEFEVAIRGKEVEMPSQRELGVIIPPKDQYPIQSGSEFIPLGYRDKNSKQILNEAYVQIIKNDFPITIEEAASGIHEILFLLTAVIGENDKVLLLDEPELHLHPTMQKRIFNLLKSKTKERNQIILVTHSPYLTSADNLNATWRFSMVDNGTKVHNVGKVLSDLKNKIHEKITIKMSSPDVRSILFSQGIILVEGPSDKIVIERVDRALSVKRVGANIDENEWPIVEMGSKDNLTLYLMLSQMLGVKSLAVLDLDALMYTDRQIKSNNLEIKTSTVFSSLWRSGKINLDALKRAVPENHSGIWYENSQLTTLKKASCEHGIFIFSADLEGVMQSSVTNKESKPLKAIERILELIATDKIPKEFFEMCSFLREGTN